MGFAPAQGSGGEGPTHLMPEQAGDPVAVLDAGTVYTKDVAGASELFFEDSAGNDVQITNAGAVVGPAPGGSSSDIQTNDGAGGFGAPGPEINASAQLLMGDGVVGAPSIAGASHLDTGIAWDIGTSGDLDFVVDGALNMRLKVDHTNFLVQTIPLSGTPAAPGFCFGNSFTSGIHSSGSNNFGSATNGIKAGWRVTNIGGGQGAVHFQDHQTAPAICCSLSGGYDSSTFDFDSGVSFHAGGDNTLSTFSSGVERTRWGASGEVITAPALANSTGIVHDSAAVQTTDATVTTLYSKTLADDTVYVYDVLVTCRDTAGTERAVYSRRVRVHRESAGVAVLGTIEASYTDESDAGMNCTFTVSTNDIRVSVTGKAGTTINWAARVTSIGAE